MKRFKFKKYQLGGTTSGYDVYIPHTPITLDPVIHNKFSEFDPNINFEGVKPAVDKSKLSLGKDLNLKGLTGSVNYVYSKVKYADNIMQSLSPADILGNTPYFRAAQQLYQQAINPAIINELEREKEMFTAALSKMNSNHGHSAVATHNGELVVIDKQAAASGKGPADAIVRISPVTYFLEPDKYRLLYGSEVASLKEKSPELAFNYNLIESMESTHGLETILKDINDALNNTGKTETATKRLKIDNNTVITPDILVTDLTKYLNAAREHARKEYNAKFEDLDDDVKTQILVHVRSVAHNNAQLTYIRNLYNLFNDDKKAQLKIEAVKRFGGVINDRLKADKEYQKLQGQITKINDEISKIDPNTDDGKEKIAELLKKREEVEKSIAVMTNDQIESQALSMVELYVLKNLKIEEKLHDHVVSDKPSGRGSGPGGSRKDVIGYYQAIALGLGAKNSSIKIGNIQIDSFASQQFGAININSSEKIGLFNNAAYPMNHKTISTLSIIGDSQSPAQVIVKDINKDDSKTKSGNDLLDADYKFLKVENIFNNAFITNRTYVNLVPMVVDKAGNVVSIEQQLAFLASEDAKYKEALTNYIKDKLQSHIRQKDREFSIAEFFEYFKSQSDDPQEKQQEKKDLKDFMDRLLKQLNIEGDNKNNYKIKLKLYVQNAYIKKDPESGDDESYKNLKTELSADKSKKSETLKIRGQTENETESFEAYPISFFIDSNPLGNYRVLDENKFSTSHLMSLNLHMSQPGESLGVADDQNNHKQGGILTLDKLKLK